MLIRRRRKGSDCRTEGLLFFLVDGQDRARSLAQDLLGDAAFNEPGQPTPPMSDHHDEVGGQLGRDLGDDVGGLPHLVENLPFTSASCCLTIAFSFSRSSSSWRRMRSTYWGMPLTSISTGTMCRTKTVASFCWASFAAISR